MSKKLNELIKELGKIVDGNQSIVEELDKLKSLYEQLKLETAEEFEYLFEIGEKYWCISSDGSFFRDVWDTTLVSYDRYSQGNVFKTKQEAEKERDRRILLTRFKQFRDKCNGDWKPKWINNQERKYFMGYLAESEIYVVDYCVQKNVLNWFGYFKNANDCERAIELFGDEIKRLLAEEE